MVTKQVKVDGTLYHVIDGKNAEPVYKYVGREAEATVEYALKNGVRNGEWFSCIDTGNYFRWDEEAQKWIKQ